MENYICPVCQNEEHPEGAQYCCICGAPIQNKNGDTIADKNCKEIKLLFEDGTVETIEHGCAISIGPSDNEEEMKVEISFANGGKEEVANVFYAMQRLAGGDDHESKH